ncbi:MAG: hypothetical protein ACETWB_08210 [Anaerolineae bacterium]
MPIVLESLMTLEWRLKAMTGQLPLPFRDAALPELWPPIKALVARL